MTRALALAVLLCAARAAAQDGPPSANPFTFDLCDGAKEASFRKGDVVRLDCDVFIQNALLHAQDEVRRQETQKLVDLLEQRRKVADDLVAAQDRALASTRKVDEINERYYAQLRQAFDASGDVAGEAIGNTRQAISLARGIRRASFVSAGLAGAAAGVFAGYQIDNGWAGPTFGGIAGVAVGYLTNLLVLRLTGLD